MPAKSILKQTSPTGQSTPSDEEKAKAERDRRNLSIALHHANRIRHQKNIQAQILSSIETLLDCPADDTPTRAESASFASLAQAFQPSDFDSLVEERRIDGKCGYALCSSAPRSKTMGSSAAWKLKGKGAEDYCSDDCLRNALYVKSQLSEVPSWEREPKQQPQIVLQEDQVAAMPATVSSRAGLSEQYVSQEELALERGETASSLRPGQVMSSMVVEKATVSQKPMDSVRSTSASHTAIEGYEPTMSFDEEENDSSDFELPGGNDLIAADSALEDSMPAAEEDEREAWRDLFEHVDQR